MTGKGRTKATKRKAVKHKNAEHWSKLGCDYIESGKYKKALKVFKIAVKLEPKNAEFLNDLGCAYYQLGCDEDAAEVFKTAVERNPKNANYWNDLGCAYYQLGCDEDAVEVFEIAVKLEPGNAEFWNSLGLVYFGLKQYLSAAYSYIKATDHDLENATCWYNLGIAYFKLGQYKQFIESYTKAAKLEPESVILRLSNIFTIGGHPEQLDLIDKVAIPLWQKLLEIIQDKKILSEINSYIGSAYQIIAEFCLQDRGRLLEEAQKYYLAAENHAGLREVFVTSPSLDKSCQYKHVGDNLSPEVEIAGVAPAYQTEGE